MEVEVLEDRRLMSGSPYGPSPVIAGLEIDPNRIAIGDGDNWPVTWGDDNAIYTFYQDGTGFGSEGHSMGPAKIMGDPPTITGENIFSPSGTMEGGGPCGRKVSGLLMVNVSPDGIAEPTLYGWVRNLHPNGDCSDATGASLVWSADHGNTWNYEPEWGFAGKIGYPVWLNAGQNYDAAPDPAYAYFYSPDGASAYQSYPDIMLGRVPTDRMTNPDAYEFFAGLDQDGHPRWEDFDSHVPVFSNPDGTFRPGAVYDPFIHRYLLSVTKPYDAPQNYLGIFDAPNPWGPWTTATYQDGWGGDPENRFQPQIPGKWIDPNGLHFYLEYSALNVSYRFNVQMVTLTLSPVQDPGFETPNVGTGFFDAFRYNPDGSPWTFTGAAGVAGNGSGFTGGNPNAPDGTQVAFLQDTGAFSQGVDFAAGTYTLGFLAAQRANAQDSYQTFQVRVDEAVVGIFTPSSTGYIGYTTDPFTVAAGLHTIWFEGLNPNGGDNTALIDQVSVTLTSAP